MKKFSAGLIFILAAIAATIPYVNGILAEKAFTRGLEAANSIYADSGSDLSVELIHYDRGFYSSTVQWKIHLGEQAELYNVDEVLITDRARHRFTGVTSQTDLRDNEWFAQLIDTKLGGALPFDITSFYSLSGAIRSTITIHPFTFQQEGVEWSVKAGTIVGTTDRHFKQFTSAASWDGFSLDEFLEFREISVNSDMTMINPLIWDGETEFNVKSFSLQKNGTPINIANTHGTYQLSFDSESNALSTGVSYMIDAIDNGPDLYKDLSVAISIEKIDAEAYEEAVTVYMDLVTELVDELSEVQDDPEAVKDIVERKMLGVGLQMMAVYEQLLKEGLKLTIKNLHAELPEGAIDADAELRLTQDVTLGQLAPVLYTPSRIFEFLSFHSNITLPKELVGKPPVLLAPIYPGMETGLFVEKDSYLVHKAETRSRKLYLNGTELHFN